MRNAAVDGARLKTHCIDDQRVAFPASDRVTDARRFDSARVFLQLQENRALQIELSIQDHDVVLVLRDPIDGAVERPVEDDARRLAGWPRAAPSPCVGLLVACLRELGPAEDSGSRGSAAATGGGSSGGAGLGRLIARLVLVDSAERHHPPADAAGICVHGLFGGPIA